MAHSIAQGLLSLSLSLRAARIVAAMIIAKQSAAGTAFSRQDSAHWEGEKWASLPVLCSSSLPGNIREMNGTDMETNRLD